jgi:hypothetical protein
MGLKGLGQVSESCTWNAQVQAKKTFDLKVAFANSWKKLSRVQTCFAAYLCRVGWVSTVARCWNRIERTHKFKL